MKSYPIYLNYDPRTPPVGRVEIDESLIPESIYPDIAIVPTLVKDTNNPLFRVMDFALIQRTHVDTRTRTELGQ